MLLRINELISENRDAGFVAGKQIAGVGAFSALV